MGREWLVGYMTTPSVHHANEDSNPGNNIGHVQDPDKSTRLAAGPQFSNSRSQSASHSMRSSWVCSGSAAAAALCAYNSRLMNNWVHHLPPPLDPHSDWLGKLGQMTGLVPGLGLGLGLRV